MAKKRIQYREMEETFRFIPFNVRIRVVVTTDIAEAARRRKDIFKDFVPDSNWIAYTASLSGSGVLMVLNYAVRPTTIVHESCHATTFALENAGVEQPFERGTRISSRRGIRGGLCDCQGRTQEKSQAPQIALDKLAILLYYRKCNRKRDSAD